MNGMKYANIFFMFLWIKKEPRGRCARVRKVYVSVRTGIRYEPWVDHG
jgi:hypothetical protein